MLTDVRTDVRGSGGIRVGDTAGNVSFSALGDIVGGDKILTINTTIQISVDAISQRPLVTSSPYRGLDRFEDRNRDLFFGRDQLVKSLLGEIGERHLLLVLGASGSGKSSLVRAGLLPALSTLIGPRFRYFTLVPDQDPFESLRSALHGAGFAQAQTATLVADPPGALPDVILRLQQPGEQWLIFVDQFEEIFTRTDDRHRARFIDALRVIARDAAGATKLVMAMRAEFVDRFGTFPEFANLIQKSIALVADMRPDELRLAIEQPAARHGVVFEAGLVEEIIGAVQGQPGSLPLLQYSLHLLWEHELREDGLRGRTLRKQTYRELGGVRGAVEKRGDEIYADIGRIADPEVGRAQQDIVRKIFLRLVDISGVGADDAAWRPVRRRVPRTFFASRPEQEVLEKLIDEKLVVSDREGTVATVEVAHEALFTSWARLKSWIEDGKQVIFAANRLSEDAARWNGRRKKDPEGAEEELSSGSRLAQAMELRSRGEFVTILGGLRDTETEFLDSSAALREKRRKQERERQSRELEREKELREAEAARAREAELAAERIRRRSRLLAIVTVCAALFAAGSFWFKRSADAETARANQQTSRANAQAHMATARELVLQGEKFLPSNAALSLALAVVGMSEATASGAEIPPEVTALLRRAVLANPLLLKGPGAQAVAWSTDGEKLMTGGADGLGHVWEAATRKELGTLVGHTDWIEDVAFSPNGRLLATAARDGTARVWNAASYELVETIPCGSSTVQSVSFHPQKPWLAVAHTAGDDSPMGVIIWDLEKHAEAFHVGGFRASFSPDGTKLVTGDGEGWGSLELFDMTGRRLSSATGHTRYVHSLAWSPDSSRLATASVDDTVRVWDTSNLTSLRVLPNRFALCAAWSPDRRYLASGGGERVVNLWDASTLAQLDTISAVESLIGSSIPSTGASDYIISIAWNPAGTLLAVADRGGWSGSGGTVSARIYPSRVFTAKTNEELMEAARAQLPNFPSLDEVRRAVQQADESTTDDDSLDTMP